MINDEIFDINSAILHTPFTAFIIVHSAWSLSPSPLWVMLDLLHYLCSHIFPIISSANRYKTAQQTHKQTTKKLHRFVPFNRPTPHSTSPGASRHPLQHQGVLARTAIFYYFGLAPSFYVCVALSKQGDNAPAAAPHRGWLWRCPCSCLLSPASSPLVV